MTAIIVTAAIVLAIVLVLVVLYVTLAGNFVATHQDRVQTVPRVATDRDAFVRALHGAAGEGATRGNSVTLLQNGDEIFPAMLEAIRSSRTSVHFSSYILWSGTIAEQFIEAFCHAARRGAVVRVMLDSEGSSGRVDDSVVRRLRDAGCHFAWYRKAVWYDFTHYDRRTHRRLLIVDGVVGFTGGVGVADQWLGSASNAAQWRETHARVTGPAVACLQAGFTDNWNQCTGELLLDSRDYPALAPTGEMSVTTVISTPTGGSSAAQRVMAACIHGAARSLCITTAYFVPTPAFVEALITARRRGVSVTVITPGRHHDKPLVRRASRHTWANLLANGVAIHEYQRSMVHAKTLAVDGQLALVGSINFDPRSFSLNAECGIVVTDAGLAQKVEEVFRADLAFCTPVTAAAMDARSFTTRLGDAFYYWWRGQL